MEINEIETKNNNNNNIKSMKLISSVFLKYKQIFSYTHQEKERTEIKF